jgi:hypothetical protein
MGRNLLLNAADHGFAMVGYDKGPNKVEALRQESKEHDVRGADDIKEFIGLLRGQSALMMLVPAGASVDSVIKDLLPHLEKGDFGLSPIPSGARWHLAVDTSREAPQDFLAAGEEPLWEDPQTYHLSPRSSAILPARCTNRQRRQTVLNGAI